MSHANRAASAHPLARAIVEQHDALLSYVAKHLPASLRGLYDPADIVQDACGEALMYRGSLDPTRDPTGRKLLCTIARRRINRLRERQRVSRQRTESAMGIGADATVGLLEQLSWHDDGPDAVAAGSERRAAVRLAMGVIAAEHSSVLRDRYVDEVPAKLVAERMGRSPGAVDKLLQRAAKALRDQLRE